MLSVILQPLPLPEPSHDGLWRCSADGTVWSWTSQGEHPTTVSVGRLRSAPLGRAELRHAQSAGVRQLLSVSLRQRFPEEDQDGWGISPPGNGRPSVCSPKVTDVSLTHSGDWLACAFSESGLVGVDLESRPSGLISAGWDLFMHARELSDMRQTAPKLAPRIALALWCRKEAWLKASGNSGKIAMTELAFSEAGELVTAPADVHLRAWHSRAWQFESGLVLAVATRGDHLSQFSKS